MGALMNLRPLLLVASLLLVGCGSASTGSDPASSNAPAPSSASEDPSTTDAVAAPALDIDTGACQKVVDPFLTTLQDLNSRLSVGLNFQAYSTKVGDAKAAYDRVDWPAATAAGADCLGKVGVRLEGALNQYVKAYNSWNKCINSPSCSTSDKAYVRAQQKRWASASNRIDLAVSVLGG